MKQELQQGFTIIEILVALALLGILAAVLTGTLTGSLGLNRQSQKQLTTTAGAQQWMEEVRKSWVTQTNYDSACIKGQNKPTDYKVQFVNLGTRAETIGLTNAVTTTPIYYDVEFVASATGNCTSQGGDLLTSTTGSPAPAMRRIVVSSGKKDSTSGSWVQDARDTTLTLDVLRPLQ